MGLLIIILVIFVAAWGLSIDHRVHQVVKLMGKFVKEIHELNEFLKSHTE